MNIIKTYLITFIVFISVDLIWLGVVAKKLYSRELGYIMSPKPNWMAAIVFYLLFVGGIVFFVLNPALSKNSWTYALFVGMFFGLITYSTYDLTNLATLKDWPILITVIDLTWGTTLGGLTAVVSYFILDKI